jgi:hypothetical protein
MHVLTTLLLESCLLYAEERHAVAYLASQYMPAYPSMGKVIKEAFGDCLLTATSLRVVVQQVQTEQQAEICYSLGGVEATIPVSAAILASN